MPAPSASDIRRHVATAATLPVDAVTQQRRDMLRSERPGVWPLRQLSHYGIRQREARAPLALALRYATLAALQQRHY